MRYTLNKIALYSYSLYWFILSVQFCSCKSQRFVATMPLVKAKKMFWRICPRPSSLKRRRSHCSWRTYKSWKSLEKFRQTVWAGTTWARRTSCPESSLPPIARCSGPPLWRRTSQRRTRLNPEIFHLLACPIPGKCTAHTHPCPSGLRAARSRATSRGETLSPFYTAPLRSSHRPCLKWWVTLSAARSITTPPPSRTSPWRRRRR